MTERKRRFKAEIDGKEYTIIGPGSTAHFQAVTALLNQRLAALREAAPKLTKEDAAVLLAFNVMSDQVTAEAAKQKTEETDA
ncbi:cell division protein ZapA [Lacticaseibacillus jixianensis]|uniref:Cell division protein ZapA n=1 Tax=Lacticaseibacillus jixianensis TaxID=2486012 RepID=A0ABW4B932_9LACO|nr:cell division protein ZapA [Lacticaseibacillus jixianensis]